MTEAEFAERPMEVVPWDNHEYVPAPAGNGVCFTNSHAARRSESPHHDGATGTKARQFEVRARKTLSKIAKSEKASKELKEEAAEQLALPGDASGG